MFCCQLEELICWLYNVADITDSWVPASLDAESVKALLHRYFVGISPHSSVLRAASSGKQGTAGMVQAGDAGCIECAKPNRSTGNLLGGNCSLGDLPKTLLSSTPLPLSFPGVQERCGQPPEPDGERAGEGRSSP